MNRHAAQLLGFAARGKGIEKVLSAAQLAAGKRGRAAVEGRDYGSPDDGKALTKGDPALSRCATPRSTASPIRLISA